MLATAWDDHTLYKPGEKQPIPGKGLDQPMLWTVKYGNGCVFGDAMGHDADVMKLPGFIATYTRGAEWTATDEVTIHYRQKWQSRDPKGAVRQNRGSSVRSLTVAPLFGSFTPPAARTPDTRRSNSRR